ncbi:DUF6192 family protein [Streptomyces sp. NPDC102360]|uniref:DUF6192 family protein n=1 Tax=Streptomyces sp. NPDC102360 TaxID=3366160 RepID=UPI003815BE9D
MVEEVVPPGYGESEWREYVAEGRRSIGRIMDAKFSLGDLVDRMLKRRGESRVDDVLDEFGRQIGTTRSSLHDYRQVARAWPEMERHPEAAWNVHRILCPHPGRFELIRTLPLDPVTGKPTRWTTDHALRAMESIPQTPVTREEKVERVRRELRSDDLAAEVVGKLLERPLVAKRVVNTRGSRRSLRDAETERHEELRQEAVDARDMAALEAPPESGTDVQTGGEAALADVAPGDPVAGDVPLSLEEDVPEAAEVEAAGVDFRESPSVVLEVIGLATTFSRALRASIPDLQQIDVNEAGQAAVREVLDKVREACDWCDESVQSGRSGMDHALARMLGSERGGGE